MCTLYMRCNITLYLVTPHKALAWQQQKLKLKEEAFLSSQLTVNQWDDSD